jgi:hypothetical protein
VSVLVVAQSSSEFPEGLMNNPVLESQWITLPRHKPIIRLKASRPYIVTGTTVLKKRGKPRNFLSGSCSQAGIRTEREPNLLQLCPSVRLMKWWPLMQREDGLCYIKQLAGHWNFAKQVYLYLHTYSNILTVVQLHSDLATQRKQSSHLPFDLFWASFLFCLTLAEISTVIDTN